MVEYAKLLYSTIVHKAHDHLTRGVTTYRNIRRRNTTWRYRT